MDFITGTVRFLNQPIVKENVKNIAGTITFAFGLVEVYDIYRILKDRKWHQVANCVIDVCAKISLILSAAVSRPGIYIISSIMRCSNTSFAMNPRHPRHIASIAAVILGLPSLVQGDSLRIIFNTITSRPVLHLGNLALQRL
jgi:hypothetical protein